MTKYFFVYLNRLYTIVDIFLISWESRVFNTFACLIPQNVLKQNEILLKMMFCPPCQNIERLFF
jgi:hypothetical protein